MKTTVIISIFFAAMFIFSTVQSQTIEIQSNCCGKTVRGLTKSSKSKEIKLSDGQTYTMNFSLKKGRTYLVKINGAKSLGDVQYRIKSIDESGKVCILYDNSIDEFRDKIVFKATENGKAILEVITQPTSEFAQKINKDQVGIYIAYN
jgi:hypothetical protein